MESSFERTPKRERSLARFLSVVGRIDGSVIRLGTRVDRSFCSALAEFVSMEENNDFKTD